MINNASHPRTPSSELPLYNSRIIQTYIDYLRTTYPRIQIEELLRQAGMTIEEATDDAHWFSQAQVDQFHKVLVAQTGDINISRQAGRFLGSAKGLNLIKQFVIGLMDIETVYFSLTRIIPMISKGVTTSIRKLGPGRMELTSTPKPGVEMKLFQCENQIGYLEALPRLFTDTYAAVEHPACYHRGDSCCRYIITWNPSMSLKLRRVRNYMLPISLLALIAVGFFLPITTLFQTAALLIILNLIISKIYDQRRLEEQTQVIESHHKMAEAKLESANTSYNNALLVREIGQATAVMFDVNELMRKVAELMQARLSFDRAMILLADDKATRLVYSAGYGYDENEKDHLEQTEFRLDNPDSKGAFVRAFWDQQDNVVNDFDKIGDSLSLKSRNLVKKLGVRSLLCVPIVYEDRSLGILAVDNSHTMVPLKKSDVHLLQGIASHIAISINNSRSFQKLRESEAKYRQTLESIAEGYFELDHLHAIVFVNNAFSRLLDYNGEELFGHRLEDLFSAESGDQIGELLTGMQDHGHSVGFAHFTMTRKDGGSIPVDLSASLACDTNGKFCGFRGMVRDATDRLTGEKEKAVLQSRLIQAQKMESLGTLAGGIAHNFNNWLGGILGNATLIRLNSHKRTEVEDKISKIEHIVESAARMTQQLLSYARGGKYKVDLIDLNAVITESAEMFGVARKDVAVHLKLDPSIASVKADKGQIEQILWNLYVNALDAMPSGGQIVIETRKTTSDALKGVEFEIVKGDYVCFSVTDDGAGIAPDHLKKIFEPFFSTKNGKGTGLGLASVYGIVKSHGGYVDVRSTEGRGSTFNIFLPAAKMPARRKNITPHSHAISTGREKILLVDDEEIILDACGQMLAGIGYTALTARSARQALEIYATEGESIKLVIIDMIMPEMNGSELFYQLKTLNPQVRVLLSSGYSLNEHVQKLLDNGCRGFIQKPYDIAHLSEVVRKVIEAN